jgi:hypothetical protein
MNQTRIFIKTYKNDFPWLDYLLRSLDKYAKDFSGITIVCDSDKGYIPEYILKRVTNISLKVVYLTPPTTKPISMKMRLGYMWQQWIKLNWWNYCSEKYCVQIDSDCIFKKQFSPKDLQNSNGEWYWHYRPWSSMPQNFWKESTEKILGIKTINQGMLGHSFVLEREITKNLIKHWTKQPAKNWSWDFILKNNIEHFSEYCLYGSFIELLYPTKKYCKKVWDNSKEYSKAYSSLSTKHWSYGGITEEIKKEYESYL